MTTTYTVTLRGSDSEGNPLVQRWSKNTDALGALASVTQILCHKAEAEPMYLSSLELFNGTIEITENKS